MPPRSGVTTQMHQALDMPADLDGWHLKARVAELEVVGDQGRQKLVGQAEHFRLTSTRSLMV